MTPQIDLLQVLKWCHFEDPTPSMPPLLRIDMIGKLIDNLGPLPGEFTEEEIAEQLCAIKSAGHHEVIETIMQYLTSHGMPFSLIEMMMAEGTFPVLPSLCEVLTTVKKAILSPNRITPAVMTDMLRRLPLTAEHFLDNDVIDAMLFIRQAPSLRPIESVLETHLEDMHLSRGSVRLIRERLEDRAREVGIPLSEAILSLSHYNLSPPAEIEYQHPDLMARVGVTVLAGRPKVGKSYLSLNLALAVACGTRFLDTYELTYPGDVLYLALEDSDSRFYSRSKALMPGPLLPDNLYVTYTSPGLDGSFCDEVSAWLAMKPNARLMVIDIFGLVKSKMSANDNVYDAEYRDMMRLKCLSETHQVHILLVTHLNKNYSSVTDTRDAIMSSTAVSGGASGIWVLEADGDSEIDAVMSVSGKDIGSQDLGLKRIMLDGHMDWRSAGNAESARADGSRADVLVALYRWKGEWPKPMELKEECLPQYNRTTFYKLLDRMKIDGLLKIDRGRVQLTNQGASEADSLCQMPDF